jgi:hypothetical protein
VSEMEYLFTETKYTLLISDKFKIDGVTYPVRMEVTHASDDSVYVKEIIESRLPVILNTSVHHTWNDFCQCFKEAAACINEAR